MALPPGTRIGSCEITAQIGAGGMGEVYRATDTNLARQVAIKVLPEAVASDAERLARFDREAKTLAALNHPNIAAIYGLERSGGTTALVMELVEGPTLADRIAQGSVPVDEALAIAKQIAEALEAAHEQGIVHRDLKPANVKVRADGTVKVLDFGLAKALDPVASVASGLTQSPTITTPAMTQAGLILGTAAYMSPEQARGKPVDRRADIWALGVVLFEMLTGRPAFEGEDVGDLLAAVVKTEVDWSRLPGDTPARIRTLLRRCLRKHPRQRLADAGAVRIEIEDATVEEASDTASRSPWQRVVPLRAAVAIGLLAVAVAFALGGWLRTPAALQSPPVLARLTLPLAPGTEVARGPSAVISPDGTQVAFVATRGSGVSHLYIRPMDGVEAREIPDTAGATGPVFSPDGQWLAFFAGGQLEKVSTTGSVVEALAAISGNQVGSPSWGPDDTIVFNPNERSSLLAVSSEGGEARRVLTTDVGDPRYYFPGDFLPGGRQILVWSFGDGSTADDDSIYVLSLDTGELARLLQGGSQPRYVPTGHLVFHRAGSLFAVPFDVEALTLEGTPVPVIDGVRQAFSGAGAFSCSRSGTCVYVAGSAVNRRTVTLVDRMGARQPLPLLPPDSYLHPRFSPEGDKVAFWIEQVVCDIEVYEVARGSTRRLPSEGDNHSPTWTPDGRRITYVSRRPDQRVLAEGWELFSMPASGGIEEPVREGTNVVGTSPLSWSPDGEMLAFVREGDIWVLSPSGTDDTPHPLWQSRAEETSPEISPDGKWLAYVSDESGRAEVYVQRFPELGETYPVSTGGGTEPAWAQDGGELFYRNGNQMLVVDVGTGPAFSASRPRQLFAGPFARSPYSRNYDVTPDGQRFVMLDAGEEEGVATQIDVLQNWFEELNREVPTN